MNVVNLISDKLKESINKFGTASLVVPGGSSPIKIFKDLSQIELSWSKVQITLVDDRLVDPQNENSNQKLLSEYFFINKAKNANFFPLSEDLIFNKKFKIPFDVTLIGMGEDGHFASLFPSMIGDKEGFSIEANHKIFKTSPQGEPFLPRITMNLSLIMSSELIILLVKGKAKQNILELAKNDETYPIHFLLKNKHKNFIIEKINE